MSKNQRGFTFIIVILTVVILGIATTSILTLMSTAVKREKEEELIYRLDKVRTALKDYRKKYNRYPSHLEELLVNKYVRNAYLIDPITNKEWVTVTADFKEGYGIKDIHSNSEESAITTRGGKDLKQSAF